MMFSMLLSPDTPEWLLMTVVVVFVIFLFGLGAWGLVLEYKYINPFRLVKASNRDKWRRAAILALIQSAIIPIIGFVAPIMSPLSDQWLFIPICSGIWIVILPIATLYKRWDFERHIKNYQCLDKMIKDKNGVFLRLFASPLISWTRIFMTADIKRFLNEGFPDDMSQEQHSET